jgi:AraC-like DNA-binding protein
MPVEGAFTVTYRRRAAVEIGSGSMLLVDQAERYKMTHGDGMRMIGVEFPRALLEKALPNASTHSGSVVCADCGALRDLRDLLHALDPDPDMGGQDVDSIPSAMADSIAELVAATVTMPSLPVITKGNQVRARAYGAYIESRLSDADLRPLDVAQAFKVSERYMRSVLHASGEPFSALLLRLRHERAAQLLRGKHQPHHNMTILDIALECGFKSDSNFCRSFKRRFRVTPGEFRRS